MDWIDEVLRKCKKQLNRISLKRALFVYIMIAICGVIMCSAATTVLCYSWSRVISSKYGQNEETDIPIVYLSVVTSEDKKILKFLDAMPVICIFVYSILAIILIAHYYYKNKLKEPMNLLKEEMQYISRNDLSLECSYQSDDEMGEICKMCNEMRLQLIKNQESIWDLMEGQRKLNAAFAHDLRTPLTVMQGYTDLLVKYYPKGKITEEKLMETLSLLQTQVIRMKEFSETMKGINDFDAMILKPVEVPAKQLHEKLEQILAGLRVNHKVEITLEDKVERDTLWLDQAVVLQVMDNLMGNALSYCKQKIDVVIETEEEQLILYIRDDGCGFGEKELYIADRPYYSGRDEKENSQHYGIGLSICKMLCEKHGGRLTLSNSTYGGAIVCATFRVI